jgi:ribosomal protein S12 methylthiotransferase accessory factor
MRSPAGHALTYLETEERLGRVLNRVPVTRLYDVTPLDWIGLPVWTAVTPLALDLTIHAGKGTTAAAARISAAMEAIERVSAEEVSPERVLHSRTFVSIVSSGDPVVDPASFDLPFETRYQPDRPVSWIQGIDLLAGDEPWVPLDLVVNPPYEGICIGVETNGLAAGNTVTEATLHAFHELIERDALAVSQFADLYAAPDARLPLTIIANETLPSNAAAYVERLGALGLRVVIEQVPSDFDVPVFLAAIYDSAFPGREGGVVRFEGAGADLDPSWAVTRAICEAIQTHSVEVLGARDTAEVGGGSLRLAPDDLVRRILTPSATKSFAPLAAPLPDDLYSRLLMVLERLRAGGLERNIVVDLTRPHLGIPVVRVLVPGLQNYYGQTTRRPGERLLRMLV